MGKYYFFESLHNISDRGNLLRNKLEEETSKYRDPYPWLKPNYTIRSMTDRQIMERTIALNMSCLSQKNNVYEMMVKYGESFSLRDEKGIWPILKYIYNSSMSLHFYKTFLCQRVRQRHDR